MNRISFLAVNVAGVLAFAFPFFVGSSMQTEAGARSADAPWILALLVPMLIAVAITEASGGKLDAKGIALLGILAGLAALLRIPVSFGGANLMFFLPIAGGFVFGARFGFLLGALSMAASAAITGGIGPWLPFQMWAAGWVGMGAGWLRPAGDRLAGRPRLSVVMLAAYGYIAGLLYGAIINLYFWPLVSVASETGWAPGLGLAETLRHYRAFYLLTSLGYDAFRGVGNAAIILIAGPPVIDLLRRYRRRFSLEVETPLVPSGDVSRATPAFRGVR